MNPTQIIKHYLSFSRGEQRGVFVLVSIILFINILRIYLPDILLLDPDEHAVLQQNLAIFERTSGPADKGASFPGFPDSTKLVRDFKGPSFVIELNGADTLDLQRLRGIGPSFARRITGYRKRLGGFFSVDQLLEVYGMDSARYLEIRQYLKVDASHIQKMNVNTIPFKKLIAHPYMPYELAKEIAIYVKKHKGIFTVEELKGLKNVDSITMIRLTPYLNFE